MGKISDNELPHRTKIADLVIQRFKAKYNEMQNEIRVRLSLPLFPASAEHRAGFSRTCRLHHRYLVEREQDRIHGRDGSLHIA